MMLAASALVGDGARADDAVVTALAVRYAPETISIVEGDSLTFVNADPVSLTDGHDVTHLAPPEQRLFGSRPGALIGSVEAVVGVELLAPGAYPFFCTRHPEVMLGTLRVTAY